MLTKLEFKKQAILVDGQWIAADSGRTIAVTDPATGETIGTIPNAGKAETRRAIEAAHATFPAWRAKTAAERAALLQKLAELIRQNSEALAHLLTQEQGKPLAEARGEIGSSAAYVQWFAEEARRAYGEVVPSPWADRRILVTREPVGVVGAITPWNFPSSMIGRKLGAALAAGCTIVIKPADLTPYSGLAWGVLCAEAGIPAGVVNIVTGDAPEIGAELTSNPLVRKITFTGSTPVGKLLAQQSAGTMKRISMELGGNAPFIVFDDADLDRAVQGALQAKYRNAGQTCVCTNRFYVQAGIHDAFARRFAEEVAKMRVGSGFESGVQIGPLIDTRALTKVKAHLDDILARGGEVVTGGKSHALGGTFFEPTVVKNVPQDARVATEETFGPLAPIFRFETEAEVVSLANATEYGLAAYFYTRDLARAFRVSEALKYGMVGVNEGLITTEVAPFGGVKESGVGREGSRHGLEDYLDMKYVCLGGIA
ncbi:NAD-dependent succinate-semialdehyde dehydrogenase [Rhabdaerophilum sp. SD176]|uniref:NAD-dependent succinate-semialdehyde dehydrogenase n=1 Tax=Rhabdaerophilum sp. SD176 TaxID=2983548 RepID=UPI0024E01EB5|nr:NAD-dependent succinate-semialdehyde dehydrogenase [Rhabdaerophilum sp. SD176]